MELYLSAPKTGSNRGAEIAGIRSAGSNLDGLWNLSEKIAGSFLAKLYPGRRITNGRKSAWVFESLLTSEKIVLKCIRYIIVYNNTKWGERDG